jgi:phytoene dehydrogenase-like protein
LELRPFEPGALIRCGGRFQRLVDPWRRPKHVLATAFSSVGSLGDKLRVAGLRRRVGRMTLDELYQQPEQSTIERLRQRVFRAGSSSDFSVRFWAVCSWIQTWRPPSRLFTFVFRMFADDDAVLPAQGMHAIARQLAERLPPGTVRTNSSVERLEARSVRLADGRQHLWKNPFWCSTGKVGD